MYGGEVELKESNIKTILKFSTLFQIQEMYNLCLDWVTQHISTLNLFTLIEFGLLIQRIGEGNNDVLDICTSHVKDNVKDELSEMSKGWVIVNNFVKFLVQEDILYYTLQVLTTWVANDVNVRLILAELEVKGLGGVLWEYGERSSDLMEKMGEKVELLETSKQLQKVQSQNFRSVSARVEVPKTEKKVELLETSKQLQKVQSQNFRSASVRVEVPKTEKKVELLETSKLLQKVQSQNFRSVSARVEVPKIEKKVELLETSKQLQKVQSQNFRSVSVRVEVPKTERGDLASLLAEDYKRFSLEKVMTLEENYEVDHVKVVDIALAWILTNVPTQSDLDKLWKCFKLFHTAQYYLTRVRNSILHMNTTLVIPEVLEMKPSQYKYLALIKQLSTYKDLSSLELVDEQCRHCSAKFSFKVEFIDKLPCWEITSEGSHAIKSVCLRLYRPQQNNSCFYSLLTNNLTSFQETVAELWGSKGKAYLWCLYTCPDK